MLVTDRRQTVMTVTTGRWHGMMSCHASRQILIWRLENKQSREEVFGQVRVARHTESLGTPSRVTSRATGRVCSRWPRVVGFEAKYFRTKTFLSVRGVAPVAFVRGDLSWMVDSHLLFQHCTF